MADANKATAAPRSCRLFLSLHPPSFLHTDLPYVSPLPHPCCSSYTNIQEQGNVEGLRHPGGKHNRKPAMRGIWAWSLTPPELEQPVQSSRARTARITVPMQPEGRKEGKGRAPTASRGPRETSGRAAGKSLGRSSKRYNPPRRLPSL